MFRKVIKFNAFEKFGIVEKEPRASAVIEEYPKPNNFTRLFFQIEGFLKSTSLSESLKKILNQPCPEILDFLNGKPYLIEKCSFKVQSYRDVFPSEATARQIAQMMVQNHSPFIEILEFFDDCDQPNFVSCEIKEKTCGISNYKIDIDATSRQKVCFDIHFDLIIQLKNRIQSVRPELFLTPTPVPSNIKFYSYLKTVLEHPGKLYITDKDCLKMKNRCIEDSENAFMHEFKEYFKKGSFVEYFRIVQKECNDSIWKSKFDFFSQLENYGFAHSKDRLVYRTSVGNESDFYLRVDMSLTMNSLLLEERLMELVSELDARIVKINECLLTKKNFNAASRNLHVCFHHPSLTPNEKDSSFVQEKKNFVDRMQLLKNGLQSALHYLKREVWNVRKCTPIEHLGNKILKTMRLDSIIYTESEIPVLKKYACQIVSGLLLEV